MTSGVASDSYFLKFSLNNSASLVTVNRISMIEHQIRNEFRLTLSLEVSSTGPALGWVEEIVWDVRAGLWNAEVEDCVGLVIGLCQLAAVDGVENGAGVFERAALATGGGTSSDPTGVEQPGVDLVLLHLLGKHGGVLHWVKGEERLGEAGREGGLWLSDTYLGTGHLGGVTGDEVEHGLLWAELGDWWKNTTSVAGEENDVGWVAIGDARNLGVLNVLDWVCATGVLSKGDIVVVDQTGLWIENDVLKDGTELDGVENIGLLFG